MLTFALSHLLLSLIALYCGALWLLMAYRAYVARDVLKNSPELRREVQAHTFHLGLCLTIAAGFLSLGGN